MNFTDASEIMTVKELAEFVLKASQLDESEFEEKMNSLSTYNLQNAREMIIILDMTKRTSLNVGYEKGAKGFRDWLISRYPAIKEWFDSVGGSIHD